MECENHFCFVKQLLYILSISCFARYKIISMKMQVRFVIAYVVLPIRFTWRSKEKKKGENVVEAVFCGTVKIYF